MSRTRLDAGGYDRSGASWGLGPPLYYWAIELREGEARALQLLGCATGLPAIFPFTLYSALSCDPMRLALIAGNAMPALLPCYATANRLAEPLGSR